MMFRVAYSTIIMFLLIPKCIIMIIENKITYPSMQQWNRSVNVISYCNHDYNHNELYPVTEVTRVTKSIVNKIVYMYNIIIIVIILSKYIQ